MYKTKYEIRRLKNALKSLNSVLATLEIVERNVSENCEQLDNSKLALPGFKNELEWFYRQFDHLRNGFEEFIEDYDTENEE